MVTQLDNRDPLRQLASGVLEGEPRAVEDFVRAIGPIVLRVTRQILGLCHPDVPDVVQEASFAAIEALSRFRSESSLLHFVCRVAALTAMNARRKLQLRERYTGELLDLDLLTTSEPSPLNMVVAAKRREVFRQLLEELPPEQAEALTTYCVLGWTIEEAAEVAQVPANTVRSRVIAAKAALRKKLSSDPELLDLLQGVS